MRAAQINEHGVVINYAEVGGFHGTFLDPLDSVIGSTWNGEAFQAPAPIVKTPEEIRAEFKVERAARVAAIVVTVDSMNFDGDEISQSRMARAIVALEAAAKADTTWVLSDNTVVVVTVDQLKQALIKAGQAQTDCWVQ